MRRALTTLSVLGLVVAPVAVGATKSPVRKSTKYAGTTSQGDVCRHGTTDGRACDIRFKTSSDRKRIATLTVRWRGGPCSADPNQFYRAATDFQDLAIYSSKSKFKYSGSYTANLAEGATATNTVALTGRFRRSSSGRYSASGTFSVVSDVVQSNGSKTHCETGKVSWSAKPAK